MNEADRLFARVAIGKSYVTAAHVEEASSYLEKLRSGPGGASLPLSLGSILAKLGRLTQVQVATVQKEMEPFAFSCSACSRRAFRLEQGDAPDGRCDACRAAGTPAKPGDGTARTKTSKPTGASGATSGAIGGGSSLSGRPSLFAGEKSPPRGETTSKRAPGATSPLESKPAVRSSSPIPAAASKAAAPARPSPAAKAPPPSAAARPDQNAATMNIPEEELAHSRSGRPAQDAFRGAPTEVAPREGRLVIDAGEYGETTGKVVDSTRAVKADESPARGASPLVQVKPAKASKAAAAAPPPGPDPHIGKTIGGCKIEQFLGRGGMGTVYKATQVDLERTVAFKVLAPHLTADPKQVAQFLREAKALAKLEHANIVSIYNAAKEEDVHFIIMQYVAGGGLDGVLKRDGPRLPFERTVKFVEQAARGLIEAHMKGITHRDVKPENLLVADGDLLKVTDFGLARMDQDASFTFAEGRIVGTPYYMSPEQIDGRNVDNRTDIYALGATFYYMLTGQKPFEGDTPVEILLKHVNEELVPPRKLMKDVPESLSRMVEKMMAKSPDMRYQSLKDFVRDLETWRGGQEVKVELARPEKPPELLAMDAPGGGFLPGLAPVTGVGPVVIERPRSFYYLVGSLVAATVLALAVGAVPLRAIMSDADAQQSPREIDAATAWTALKAEPLKDRAAVERLKKFGEEYKDTRAAAEAEKQTNDLVASLKADTDERVKKLLGDAEQNRAAGKFGLAIEGLRMLPKELEGSGADKAVEPVVAALKKELAETRGQAYVPAGVCIAGDKESEQRRVLPGFYMDLTEVRNADYADFVKGHGPAPLGWAGGAPKGGTEEVPVTGISARDAEAYARSKGKRLPTALEWEKAARGPDGLRFPWGNNIELANANCRDRGTGRLEPVTSRPKGASPYGCLNMAGNAAEWTITPLDTGEAIWVKGGAFDDDLIMCRPAFWNSDYGKDEPHPAIGFRCAQDAEK